MTFQRGNYGIKDDDPNGSCQDNTCTSQQVVVGMVKDAGVSPGAFASQAIAALTSSLRLKNTRMIEAHLDRVRQDTLEEQHWIQASTSISASTRGCQPDKDLMIVREQDGSAHSSSRASPLLQEKTYMFFTSYERTKRFIEDSNSSNEGSSLENCIDMKNAKTDAFSVKQASGSERIISAANQTKDHQSEFHNVLDNVKMTCESSSTTIIFFLKDLI